MSLVFTDSGIAAINTAKSNGFMLDLISFKVTDGIEDPLVTDTKSDFESDGTVHFTGTTASGYITNKRIIDDHTFNIDIIVPPDQPLGGGSFNITKMGIYVDNPDPAPPVGEEVILLAATKFEGTFQKFAPSATNAGNSLVLTLVVGLDNASATISVLDTSNRDWNFYSEVTTVDTVPNANDSSDRVVRVTRPSTFYPGGGNNTYLLHSTKSGGVTVAEWVPDNHSLLFPLHALPSINAGIVGISTHAPNQIHVVYDSTTLDDADTHVFNNIPPAQDGLLISLFVDNPAGVGGEIRQVVAVTQYIDLDDSPPGNVSVGREMLVFDLATPFSSLPGVNQLFKLWASNTALTPGSGGGGAGGFVEATPNAVADKIIQRDGNQSAKVGMLADGAGTADSQDIANRAYVQEKETELSQALTDHDESLGAHQDLVSITAVASRIIIRDVNGRSEIVTPVTDPQIANKYYVDQEILSLSTAISDQIETLMGDAIDAYLTANLDSYLDPKITEHNNDTDAHSALFEEGAVSSTVPKRDSSGRLKAQDPNAPEDLVTLNYLTNLNSSTNPFGNLAKVSPDADTIALRDSQGRVYTSDSSNPTDDGHTVNLKYLKENYSVINPSTDQKQGDLQFLPDSEVPGGYRIYSYVTSGVTVQLYPAQYT